MYCICVIIYVLLCVSRRFCTISHRERNLVAGSSNQFRNQGRTDTTGPTYLLYSYIFKVESIRRTGAKIKNVSTLDRFKRSLETLLYFKQTLSSVGENLRMDKKEKYPNQLQTGFQKQILNGGIFRCKLLAILRLGLISYQVLRFCYTTRVLTVRYDSSCRIPLEIKTHFNVFSLRTEYFRFRSCVGSVTYKSRRVVVVQSFGVTES